MKVQFHMMLTNLLADNLMPALAAWITASFGLAVCVALAFVWNLNLRRLLKAQTRILLKRNIALESEVSDRVQEINERKEASKLLLESEQRSKILVQQIPAVLWTTDRDLVFTSSEGAGLKVLGRRQNDVVGVPLTEYFGTSDPSFPALAAHVEALKGSPTTYSIVWMSRHFDCLVEPLYDTSGNIIGTIGLGRDITERVEADERLRTSQRHLADAQRITHLGSWELDLTDLAHVNRNPLRWSDEVFRIFGYRPGEIEVSNESFFARVHPEDRDRIAKAVSLAIEQGEKYKIDHRIVLPNGEERIVHERSEIEVDESGRPRRMIGTIQDVTAIRRAEEEIRKLNAELERRVQERTAELEAFAYSISHDLRAPLRAIDGFTRIIEEDYLPALPQEAAEVFSTVRENAQRMGRLLEAILAFSRLGQAEMKMADVDLNQVVQDVHDSLSHETEGRQVEWITAHLPTVKGEPLMIHQLYFNLLSNALKFTRPRSHARIEVGCQRANSNHTLFVRDNGVGFPSAQAPLLFGFFQRLHRSDQFEGNGVGLAFASRIVKRHGGQIWAESEEGIGTKISFTLGLDHVGKQA